MTAQSGKQHASAHRPRLLPCRRLAPQPTVSPAPTPPAADAVSGIRLADGSSLQKGRIHVQIGTRWGVWACVPALPALPCTHAVFALACLWATLSADPSCLSARPCLPSIPPCRWGKVCSGGFGAEEASVVCRELGLSGGRASATFPARPGLPFIIGRVACTGSERRLAECKFVATAACATGKAAGVVCSGERARGGHECRTATRPATSAGQLLASRAASRLPFQALPSASCAWPLPQPPRCWMSAWWAAHLDTTASRPSPGTGRKARRCPCL